MSGLEEASRPIITDRDNLNNVGVVSQIKSLWKNVGKI